MKKTIDLMAKFHQRNNLAHHVVESAKKKTEENELETRDNGQDLIVLHSRPQE